MDTNRIIKIEQLEEGDEIITPSGGKLKYYRVIRKPKLNTKTSKWSGTRCSMKLDTCQIKKWQWDSNLRKSVQVDAERVDHIVAPPEEHNHEMMIYGLQWKVMWLVKRGGTV